MANPTCTFCEQYEGVLMATNLINGDTVIACGQCVPGYALGMSAGIIGGMSKEDAKQYAGAIDQVYASDPRGPKPPPAPKGRKPRQAPPPEVVPDAAPDAAPEVVAMPDPCSACGGMEALGDADKLACRTCGAVIATADAPLG
jgi:hypothetical protein